MLVICEVVLQWAEEATYGSGQRDCIQTGAVPFSYMERDAFLLHLARARGRLGNSAVPRRILL